MLNEIIRSSSRKTILKVIHANNEIRPAKAARYIRQPLMHNDVKKAMTLQIPKSKLYNLIVHQNAMIVQLKESFDRTLCRVDGTTNCAFGRADGAANRLPNTGCSKSRFTSGAGSGL